MSIYGIILLIGLGVFAFFNVLHTNFLGKKSLEWSSVEGEILTSELLKKERVDKNPLYEVKINYCYKVDGKLYNSNRVTFKIFDATDKELNEKIINGFKEGDLVSVYYDPNKHGRSVLIPGAEGGVFAISISFFIMVVGIAAAIKIYVDGK